MIKIHRDNRVIFWLLIGALVLNIVWSLRLELQAQTTQTLVEKYHLNLNNKLDVLTDLKEFKRWADHIEIGSNVEGPIMYLDSDNVGFKITGGSGPLFQLGMFGKKDLFQIACNKSYFNVGKIPFSDKSVIEGIHMGHREGGDFAISKKDGTAIADKRMVLLKLRASGENSKEIQLEMRRDKGEGLVKISNQNSVLRVDSKNISIEADGDINIRSNNGEVKINGKKIHMNK